MTAFTHRRTVRIEWGDCDPAGIVFYPRYFAMFDGATQELFRAALGVPKIEWAKSHGIIGIPMVDTRAKFMIPSRYGDDIIIESRVAEFRRSSFDIVHTVHRPEGIAIEATETRVWAGPDPLKPGGIKGVPIPLDVIRAFTKA
ncbi:MAG: acyl-CoA thioesterase [Hyphomicrobiaceae bacterium]|nr:acyl-CoA thioesterase [Hyphomicrobiaceae bacterium]